MVGLIYKCGGAALEVYIKLDLMFWLNEPRMLILSAIYKIINWKLYLFDIYLNVQLPNYV